MSSENKIRVAVLTRGDYLEAWEIAALEAVKNLEFAEIVLEIRDGSVESSRAQSGDGLSKKLKRYKWSRLFWNRWFKKYGKVNATNELSASKVLQHVPRIDVVPELKGKFSQHFSLTDIVKVKQHSPDVILRFGFNILRGDILTVATHGVWSYHHADPMVIRGGPASFWEYILKENTTGAILQRLTEKLDNGIVLREGTWSLVKHSFRENLDSLLMNSSGWMANALTELHHNGKIAPPVIAAPVTKNVYSYPGNFRMIQFWFILFGNKIAFHWKNLFRPETWQIGIVDQPIGHVMSNGIQKEIKWIRAKRNDSYLADPFHMQSDNKSTIVAEYFSGEKQKSHIVNAETEEILLERDYHVSFPLPVDINGQQYICPEMSASGTHSLFRLNDLNATLNLIDAPLVDPVLFAHNNRWWIFAHRHDEQNNAALFIYHSDYADKGFVAHVLNPVKTNIRNSRSAGAILNINGKLIRPAQDSAITYGNAIVFNEILELTPTSFVEKPFKRIEANEHWEYNRGIHTINSYGDKTLIDAKSFRFNFANFKAQISRKARRISGK